MSCGSPNGGLAITANGTYPYTMPLNRRLNTLIVSGLTTATVSIQFSLDGVNFAVSTAISAVPGKALVFSSGAYVKVINFVVTGATTDAILIQVE